MKKKERALYDNRAKVLSSSYPTLPSSPHHHQAAVFYCGVSYGCMRQRSRNLPQLKQSINFKMYVRLSTRAASNCRHGIICESAMSRVIFFFGQREDEDILFWMYVVQGLLPPYSKEGVPLVTTIFYAVCLPRI